MKQPLKIGTRDSQLAVWQATHVQDLLKSNGIPSELVYIKSEGDIDTITPLYALGVTGIFTKTLDAALLNKRIDIAVHSMKDVPVQLALGIQQAAVLKRASYKDILVPHPELADITPILGMGKLEVVDITITNSPGREKETKITSLIDSGEKMDAIIATSSIRRISQWKSRYPHHTIENLRGNVNTRLKKLKESNWHGAIFAAAGLERINLRPENSIELDWMLPAPAQGAIMIACREGDDYAFESCQPLNHSETALCVKIERDFLSGLMGGCSTPISALAEIINGEVDFKGNILNPDTYRGPGCNLIFPVSDSTDLGFTAAKEILATGGQEIIDRLQKKGLTTNDEI